MAEKRRRTGVVDPPNCKKLRVSGGRTEEQEIWLYLKNSKFSEEVWSAFKEHKIQGRHVSQIDAKMLISMGIKKVGDQIDVLRQLASLNTEHNDTVFNDPIHGHIELHPLLMKIVDTPQFQRLRDIKQLGGGYHVFPGASHNRFEHSIGVSHLAGEFVKCLQSRQPELLINDVDILCIRIAGLCHDLGHGPLSHMFDNLFMKQVMDQQVPWSHEKGSIEMLDHLIHCNNLWNSFEDYGLTLNDVVFIKELIYGPLPHDGCSNGECPSDSNWLYKGRDRDKSFLYEIVANKRTGIDVDKWDYFARDCHCLGIPNNFDWRRYMKFTKVLLVDGIKQICIRDKEVTNLYEMFHTRNSLHRRAYQHKTSNIVEAMITEALILANEYVFIEGEGGKQCRMSDCVHDMVAYTKLTDSVLYNILYSTDPSIAPARQLLERVQRRKLYKHIGQTLPSKSIAKDKDAIKRDLMVHIEEGVVTEQDLVILVVKFDYGMENKNPIDHMRFYTKTRPLVGGKVSKEQVSSMLPHTFTERVIRVYCKKRDSESCSAVYRGFVEWCAKQDQLPITKGLLDETNMATPYGAPFGTPAKDEDHMTTQTLPVTGAKQKLAF